MPREIGGAQDVNPGRRTVSQKIYRPAPSSIIQPRRRPAGVLRETWKWGWMVLDGAG